MSGTADWTFPLALVGAITGAIGAASGYYAHILSGYRIKARIGLGIYTGSGLLTLPPDWQGGFGYGLDLPVGGEVVYVRVLNRGRMPISIERIALRNTDGLTAHFDPVGASPRLSHRLDFGSSETWLYPYADLRSLWFRGSTGAEYRYSVRARIELGDGKVVRSQNAVEPAFIDRFDAEWAAYQQQHEADGTA